MMLAACGPADDEESVAKTLNNLDKIRLKVTINPDDEIIVANKDVKTKIEIASRGNFRKNQDGDAGQSFWSKSTYDANKSKGCNPYTGRYLSRSEDDTWRGDAYYYSYTVKYHNPPEVNANTVIEDNTKVDSFGYINKALYINQGKTTSYDFTDSCTKDDFSFSKIYSLLLSIQLTATETTCNTFCGVKVKTYCENSCYSNTSVNTNYYSVNTSSSSGCFEACTTTETPFCKETCKTKEHIVAEASVYPENISEQAKTSASNIYNAASIGAGGSGSISVDDKNVKELVIDKENKEAVLEVNLDLEPYIPLNY